MGVIGRSLNKFNPVQAAEAPGREGAGRAAPQTGPWAGLGMQMGQAAAAQAARGAPAPLPRPLASPHFLPRRAFSRQGSGIWRKTVPSNKGPFSKAALGRPWLPMAAENAKPMSGHRVRWLAEKLTTVQNGASSFYRAAAPAAARRCHKKRSGNSDGRPRF